MSGAVSGKVGQVQAQLVKTKTMKSVDDSTLPETPSPAAARKGAAPFGRGFVRDAWYFVALAHDIRPGSLARHMVMGEPVVIGRTREQPDEIFALRDICPHRAAPLSSGRLVHRQAEGETVECCYHGWRFRTDGVCAAIPSLADDHGVDFGRIRVKAYPVSQSQGMVFVWMRGEGRSQAEPDHEPPVFPGAIGSRPHLVETRVFESHIDHAVVGLMDPAHGPYVHQQWWWRSKRSIHEKAKAFEPRQEGFAMVRHPPSTNSRAYRILGGEPATEISFRLPGYRWEHVQVGNRQVLALTCLTPLTDTSTQITQLFWSDHWIFRIARPLLRLGVKAFLKQDGGMVDLQNDGLRHDPSLLWIDDADSQAKWYQQLKREWMASRAEARPFSNPLRPTTLKWKS